jgi:menaquinone-dependent protoporphyrinogen oxidase
MLMKTLSKEERGMSRRTFLTLSAGAIFASMMRHNAFASSHRQSGPEFIETTYQKDGEIKGRALIAYASRCGSTGGVADAIGQVLHGTGASIDVRLVRNVDDLSPYQTVIVGSAVRMGRWLPEAMDFMKKHRDALRQLHTAYFAVCITMKDDTAENRHKALAYLDPVRKEAPDIQPADIGLFPGAVDFGKLSPVYKSILKAKGVPEGDFRNWTAVRTWAAGISPALLGGAASRVSGYAAASPFQSGLSQTVS